MRSAWVLWFRIILRPQSPFTSFKGRAEETSWRRFPPTQPQSRYHRCCSFFLCVCVGGWVCVCSLHSWLPLVLLGCCSGILPGQGRPRVPGVGLSSPEPQLFSHHVPAEGRYWPHWNSACAPGWVEPHLAEIFSVTKSWAGASTLPSGRKGQKRWRLAAAQTGPWAVVESLDKAGKPT